MQWHCLQLYLDQCMQYIRILVIFKATWLHFTYPIIALVESEGVEYKYNLEHGQLCSNCSKAKSS